MFLERLGSGRGAGRRLGPHKWAAAFVPAVDEPFDGRDQVLDAGVAAAADGLASDDREEDLDQVQPGP